MGKTNVKDFKGGAESGSVDVLVYDPKRFVNITLKLRTDDIVFMRNVGGRKHIFGGKEKFIANVTQIPVDGIHWYSELSLEDITKRLPGAFLHVSDHIINMNHVRDYEDGVFYLKKGEQRRIVKVEDDKRKEVEGKWVEFSSK